MLLDTGAPTTADDPKRGVWYAVNHDLCGYWTDDWDKLGHVAGGIPSCPNCGCVGMQMNADEWFGGATKFEVDHPHYVEWLKTREGVCGRGDLSWMGNYHAWMLEQGP